MSAGVTHLLCAGAVQGLVGRLQAEFEAATGARLQGRYGAVGALREALLGGAPCDVMVATAAMLSELQAQGHLPAGAVLPIGRVRTGLAVRSGEPRPDITSREALKAAWLAAPALYFPDPLRATAGGHVASVIGRLGIREAMAARIRNFPNGADSMRALADEGLHFALGCTQASEILATSGVDWVGPLAGEFERATTYAVALGPQGAQGSAARRLVEQLSAADGAVLRARCGIEAA